MTEDIKQQLIKYLTDIIELGKTEIPKIANQIIVLGIVVSSLWLIISTTFLFLSWTKIRPWCLKEDDNDNYELRMLVSICTCIGCLIAITIFCIALDSLIEIIVAPKVYLLNNLI